MKKSVLLSAAMSFALSSLAFAADNPPPPPGKAVAGQQHNGHDKNRQQHSGKRPAQRQSVAAEKIITLRPDACIAPGFFSPFVRKG